MNFHSVGFGVFLILVFSLFWLTYRRRNLRTAILLVGSYVFYGAFNPLFLGLIAFSTLLDYVCGNWIHTATSEKKRKAALLLSVFANLGLLGFFKYYDWGVENLKWLLGRVGLDLPVETLGVVVPVGISFYTFQTLSYTIDLYRRRMEPARNLLDFALFVAFFPQLVAGPIVRAVDFLGQLENPPRLTRARFHDGLYRITLGLGKKVLIADVVGSYVVTPVYRNPEAFAPEMHAFALIAFLVQIYYDFSGYSDIAIGSARLFGIDLPENFALPFRSIGIREFWRRWHMTLSSWLRDYVYFPLGGSRSASQWRVNFNLMLTMFLIGMWHGADWLWVIFGLLQGAGSCIERAIERRRGGKPWATTGLRRVVLWSVTSVFISVTFICVRGDSVENGWAVLTKYGDRTEFHTYGWVAVGVGIVLHFLPMGVYAAIHRAYLALPTVVAGAIVGATGGLAAYLLLGENPFIYFQF